MLFSSLTFLWVFLPVLLLAYYIVSGIGKPAGMWAKNLVLLVASLIFYAWGEPKYILLMLVSVTVNYIFGLILERRHSRLALALCVAINLGLLGYFKYFNFMAGTLNVIMPVEVLKLRNIALPLGISFYTFQAMSYVIDVYRGQTGAQKNYLKLLLYVSFFPQLVAGPIVRYRHIEHQISERRASSEQIAMGIKRFIYGLAKKVIISNTVALYADTIMESDPAQIGSAALWLGALMYTIQIYFDFSGYSDMAIGLGKMFGFDFMENFNYPYISASVREFWRRWHISLSSWFKEYVYIPLGGNRKGKARTYVNLLIVFFLTGLWHGASFSFIIWGLYHGAFLLIERIFLGKWLDKNPIKPLNHLYTMLVVLVGWVFFRVEHISHAFRYLKYMFSFRSGTMRLSDVWGMKPAMIVLISVLAGGVLQALVPKLKEGLFSVKKVRAGEMLFLAVLLLYCFIQLGSNAYNPFIYFRF